MDKKIDLTNMSNGIATNNMVVRAIPRKWTTSVGDREITEEVETAKSADGLSVRKRLARGMTSEIDSLLRRAMQYHNAMTVPWEDRGKGKPGQGRLLKSSTYNEYTIKMGDFKYRVQLEAAKLAANIAQIKASDQNRLTSAFKDSDYPTSAEIMNKYSLEYDFDQVTSTDFRARLSPEDAAELERKTQARIKEAVKDIWSRVLDPLKKMLDQIDENPEGFKITQIRNMKVLAEILPQINIMNDPQLEAVGDEIMEKLTSYDAEDVRDNTKVRKEFREKANDIYEKVSGIMGGLDDAE